jgi:hypothetical protein
MISKLIQKFKVNLGCLSLEALQTLNEGCHFIEVILKIIQGTSISALVSNLDVINTPKSTAGASALSKT